ncbi:MAG: HAMP domain-containing histidine kinase [Bacteroidetes bacterium]|nr:HAMP domain-containing histidine kinase [Bacteroidota bacterium]
MRLLQRSLLIQAAVTFFVLIVAGVAMFFALRQMVEEEIDERLAERANAIFARLERDRDSGDPSASVSEVESQRTGNTYSDVSLSDTPGGEREPWRELKAVRELHGKHVAVVLRTSRLEWEDFSETIFVVFMAAAVLLLIGGITANALTSRRIWRPFFRNLEKLRQFSARQDAPVEWSASNIREFSQLVDSLTALTEGVRGEYRTLKEFTENASHEMQTPLSIIRTKLERIGQHPALDRELAESLEGAAMAADRLSRLNRSLILLAGVENGQFEVTQPVDISQIAATQVTLMQDLFVEKDLVLDSHIDAGVSHPCNAYLTEILIGNLLSNAIRHSEGAGKVELRLARERMTLTNPGPPLPFPSEQLFHRFRKGGADQGSSGLGLAIAKEIVRLHGWTISHTWRDGRHEFEIAFRLQIS